MPARYAPDKTFHSVLLVMSAAVLAAALLLRVQDGQRVVLPAIHWTLPETCTFKRTSGIECPGCGLTRCFISAVRGDVLAAITYNPAGLLLFALVAFQVPYRTLQLWRLRRGRPEISLHRWGQWSLVLVAILLMLQWVVRTVATLWW